MPRWLGVDCSLALGSDDSRDDSFRHDRRLIVSPLPTLFIGHGVPAFARKAGPAGPLLTGLGQALRPATVLEGGIANGVFAMDASVFGQFLMLDRARASTAGASA